MPGVEGFIYPNELELQWSVLIVLYPFITGLVAGAFILASLAMVVVFLNPLGFRISLLIFLFFLPLFLGVRNWLAIPILAVAGSFGVFHVFYYWLKLPLPIGIFGI